MAVMPSAPVWDSRRDGQGFQVGREAARVRAELTLPGLRP